MIQLLLFIIYISFISLGLPDGLLGAAWPSMYRPLDVSMGYAGIISMIIAAGTILSALATERIVQKLGTGKLTALSVGITAVALFGFSSSHSFLTICLWAIPYGLGAGSVDAALNHFVAVHFKSHHMNWLHCFWGVGCSIGPYLMANCLAAGNGWESGYRIVSLLQIVLTAFLILSLPLWKKVGSHAAAEVASKAAENPLGLRRTVATRGVKEVMGAFFCYCAIEQTASLWAVSYAVLGKGISSERAANWGTLFFLGITVGRLLSGFFTLKWNDRQMIRMGQGICAIGVMMLLLPFGTGFAMVGLGCVGLGCAPIYPCLIHATPSNFGARASQAVIGVQMASAYVGTCLVPPIFGWIAQHTHISLFPWYLMLFLFPLVVLSERLNRIVQSSHVA